MAKAVAWSDWLTTLESQCVEITLIVPRHRDRDPWDQVVITHTGTKVTVEAAGEHEQDYEHEYDERRIYIS